MASLRRLAAPLYSRPMRLRPCPFGAVALGIAVALGLVAVVGVVTVPRPASADGQAPEAKLRKTVEGMLSGYEFAPNAADWAAVGAGGAGGAAEAAAVLIQLAEESDSDLVRRARAVSSLAHFPTDKVRARLVAWLSDPRFEPMLRRKAALALGAAFGPAGRPALAAAANDADPKVREAVGQALASPPMPTPTAPAR